MGEFKLSTIAPISAGVNFAGFLWGTASANIGVGYLSGYQGSTTQSLLFKTTDYGKNFSILTTIPNGPNRGVATNASNNMLAIAYSSYGINAVFSIDGGNSFSAFGDNQLALYESCIMTRNNSNNYVIRNLNNFEVCKINFSTDNFATYYTCSLFPTGTFANSVSGANSISDTPNLFVTTSNGTNVYRNQNNGVFRYNNISNPTVQVVITNTDAGLTPKYVGTACNANNSVNFIVNRTTTTGGKIYKSTAFNGTFAAITGSPIALWNQIATSSAGNVVCAIADTSIYLSIDAGENWRNVYYTPALQTNEKFMFVTVSPDETFIIIGTNGSTAISRIFYYIL